MPATLTYPGVYIEEIPSGVRTITGVATSIAAFLGRAPRGPTNEPTTINSFGDFERQFGGLDVDYPMSYAVRDFYLNGGSQAIIARLFVPPSSTDDGAARLTDDGLKLVAGSPGAWGQGLRLAIDPEVSDEVRTSLGLGANDALFNLTVRDTNPGGTTERFLNLTVVDSARRIDRVLANESNLVRWDGPWSTPLPALTNLQTARGDLETLQDALKASPPDQTAINNARTTYNAAKADLADPVTQAEKTLADATNAQPPGDVAGAQTALAAEIAKVKGANGSALNDTAYEGDPATKSGIYALDKADLFNLLCIPADTRSGDTPAGVYQAAMSYCAQRRAMLIVDPPAAWGANKDTAAANAVAGLSALGLTGVEARNAALYFPRVTESDPQLNGQLDTFVPCGIIAGVMARTDTQRGVWKAPAGLDASLNGAPGLAGES